MESKEQNTTEELDNTFSEKVMFCGKEVSKEAIKIVLDEQFK